MKKGNKHKQKKAVPAAGKSREAPQKQLYLLKSKQEAPIDRDARRELRKQEKVQCAIQCKKYIKKLQARLLQPSRKHYGGLGYAKESIFVQLDDPDYADRFEEIWDEHVPGFSGKSFKKRKTDADESMLWRQRLKARQAGMSAPLPEELLTPSVSRNGAKAVQPKKKAAVAAATKAPASQTPGPKHKQVKKTAAVEPDLQAQVMAAYRNMKLKQREAAKKPASRHKSR